jgi:CheY-like chemotaxis protein
MDQSCAIMVVDDDAGCRDSLGEFLVSRGYRVETAANGREALQRLESAEFQPCFIILDLVMPVMGGWEFRQELGRNPHLAAIPVVAVSGIVRDLDQQAAAVEVSVCLQKPLDLDALTAEVTRPCPHHPARAKDAPRQLRW